MPKIILPEQLKSLLESDEEYAVLDVRERNTYEQEQIFGATQVPRRSLEIRIPVLIPVKDTKIILYDEDSYQAMLAAHTLESYGYTNIYCLAGGLHAWKNAGYPLVEGVHVLSKSFGEIVGEIRKLVPVILPEDLKQLLDKQPDEYIILEVRPEGEVQKTGSIPGAINIPGVELPLRIADYAKSGKTIITTCAGRTRGFIACATLKKMGIDKVYDLNKGTMGWKLAGFDLAQEIPQGPPPSAASRKNADQFAVDLAKQQQLSFITAEELAALQQQHKKTIYIADVRSPEEYQFIGHIPGAISVPGGQAVQNTDDTVVVHNAAIVFVCDNATRSIITAYWYRQMGFEKVYVLDGGLAAWADSGHALERGNLPVPPLGFEQASLVVAKVDAAALKDIRKEQPDFLVIDVSDSKSFAGGHIPGAKRIPQGWLEKRIESVVPDKETAFVVTGQDGYSPIFAALTLGKLGFRNARALDGGNCSWAQAGFPLSQGLQGTEADDWHVHLTEYGQEEAKRYFAWEESLVHLPAYMDYFQRKGIL